MWSRARESPEAVHQIPIAPAWSSGSRIQGVRSGETAALKSFLWGCGPHSLLAPVTQVRRLTRERALVSGAVYRRGCPSWSQVNNLIDEQKAQERREAKRVNSALVERLVQQLQWWCSLELSPEQYADVFNDRSSGRTLELLELVVMMQTGCRLAAARDRVTTLKEVPCPGREHCKGCPVHASRLFEEARAARAARRGVQNG